MDQIKPKHAGGRPTKYKPEYCKMIVEYFSNKKPYEIKGKKKIVNDLPTLKGFARLIGVCDDKFSEWEKLYPEFHDAYKEAKSLQEDFLLTNGLQSNYAQPFAIFAMKNICGWKDQRNIFDVTDSSNSVKKITIEIKDK